MESKFRLGETNKTEVKFCEDTRLSKAVDSAGPTDGGHELVPRVGGGHELAGVEQLLRHGGKTR